VEEEEEEEEEVLKPGVIFTHHHASEGQGQLGKINCTGQISKTLPDYVNSRFSRDFYNK
jgi:hypothetical protein